jgi:hypothetical protein
MNTLAQGAPSRRRYLCPPWHAQSGLRPKLEVPTMRMRKELRHELLLAFQKIGWAADAGRRQRNPEEAPVLFDLIYREVSAAMGKIAKEDKAERAELEAIVE